ncbi:MAG: YihY/virulence factor BrkB family protein [Thermoleophilaceae bacterium]
MQSDGGRPAPRARRVGALFSRSVQAFLGDRCTQAAAAISYYGLFSLFPLTILTVGAYGLVVGTDDARATVTDFLLAELPLQRGEGRREIESLLDQVSGNAAAFGIVGVAGLLFSASGLMGAVRSGVNRAFGVDQRRPPLVGKLLDIGLVLLAAVGILGTVGVTVVVRVAGGLGGVVELAPPILTFLAMLFAYRVLPAKRARIADVWPGALAATVGYELAKVGFTVYLDNFANYGAIYGSIGAVIAFLVFLFVAANLFLFGAEMAHEWPTARAATVADFEGGPPFRERLMGGLKGLVR